MKLVNRILRFIYAFICINILYNTDKFQSIIENYEVNDLLVILILSVATYIILFIFDVIIDKFSTKIMECTDEAYSKSIEKLDAFKTMKYLKCSNLV